MNQHRCGSSQMTLHGADQVEALFRQLDAYLEAMPFMRAEAEGRFADRESLVMRSTSPVAREGSLMSVAPSAKLLAFLTRCQRLAQARGLSVPTDQASAPGSNPAKIVSQLIHELGRDVRLGEVAEALGLPLPAHAHAMGQGQGSL